MSKLTIGVLKRVIENMPEEWAVEFNNGKSSFATSDKVEIDVGLQRLILKKY